MVRGVGIDIVEIGRIKRLIETYGDVFLNKVFTAGEIDYCTGMARPEVHFSGRWAVKEAFYKALPARLQSRATWKCIEILPDPGSGKPGISFVSDDFKTGCVGTGITTFHLSITHERTFCTAVVVME